MNETKKIKVVITEKVSLYNFEGKDYHPGDVVEIPEVFFRADFMEKVEKLKALPQVVHPVAAVEIETEALSEEKPQPEEEPKAEENKSILNEVEEKVKPKKRRK